MILLLIAGVWMGWPLMMLAATAGLKFIPREIDEAAHVDGANGWERFRKITLPLILPLLAPVIILRAIAAFNQLYLFVVLYPQYPQLTYSSMVYYLAMPSFFGGWFGAAAAASVFTTIVLLALLVVLDRGIGASKGVTYA
jgi:ABC-type sugar transport system permease subunit